MSGPRPLAAIRAWCGTAGASHLALAVLVLGCTFLALAAGVRRSASGPGRCGMTCAGRPR